MAMLPRLTRLRGLGEWASLMVSYKHSSARLALLRRYSREGAKKLQGENIASPDKSVRIMHPDWYRVPDAEDDPRMIGNYPDVPAESYQLRDPHGQYFDVQNRRNFGEPLPEEFELLSQWSFDHETQFGLVWILGSIGGLFGGYFLLHWLVSYVPSPFSGLTAPRELPTVGKYFANEIVPKSHTQKTPR